MSNDNTVRSAVNSHDNDPGIHLQSSVLASRPAAGTVGRKWLTTDGLRVYYDTGGAWSEIAYFTVGVAVSGDLLFTDDLYDIGKSGATRPRDGFFSRNLVVGGDLTLAATKKVYLDGGGDSYIAETFANIVDFTTGGLNALSLRNGIVCFGHSQTTSAATGEPILGFGKALRGVNAGNTDTLPLILLGSAGVQVGAASSVVLIGTPGSAVSAAGGELLLATGKALRSANSGGTDTFVLIKGLDIGGGLNAVAVGYTAGQVVMIGSPGVATGAVASDLLLQNAKSLRFANNAATATKSALFFGTSDQLLIASEGGVVGIGNPNLTGASSGEVVLANAKSIRGATAGGTTTHPLIYKDANDNCAVGATNARNSVYGYVNIGTEPAVDIWAAGAARNGCLVIDSTNNRLIYYSGGNRYFIPIGTSF